jgi:hypothetical protein
MPTSGKSPVIAKSAGSHVTLNSGVLAPPQPQLSFDDKMQLCLGWLSDQFNAYQQQGGKDSLDAWLAWDITQAIAIRQTPKGSAGSATHITPGGSGEAIEQSAPGITPLAPAPGSGHVMEDQRPGSTPPPAPAPQNPPPLPDEPPLVSEGVGPISWVLYGWELKSAETLGEAGEATVEFVAEQVGEWIIDQIDEPSDHVPSGGDGDGSYGTSPGDGSGLPGDGDSASNDGDGDNGAGAGGGDDGDQPV